MSDCWTRAAVVSKRWGTVCDVQSRLGRMEADDIRDFSGCCKSLDWVGAE